MTHRLDVTIEDDPVSPARRLRLWRDMVGDRLVDVDLSPAGDLPAALTLRGGMRLRAFESATVGAIRAGAQSLRRTPERIQRAPSDLVFVNVVTAGACRVDQHGGRSVAGRGAICLYDACAPYEIETSLDFASALVGLPRDLLERRVGALGAVTGAVRPGPAARVAARIWLAIADEVADMDAEEAEDLVSIGLDALAGAIRGPAPREPHAAGAARRIRRAIERNRRVPGFSARDLACEAGVSLRRLQEVCRAAGFSPAAELRRIRLEAARKLLADPALDHLPVKTLMFEAGFSEPATFSKAFRAAFGMSPAEARRRR